ncbi:MAG: Nramp family divalent metal transporter [Rhodothermales bacterium]
MLAKKWKQLLALLGPGVFLVGYNIGTGSLTTMAATGAEYGMALVWPLLISCIFTYVLIVSFGRYTAVTGKTALFSFKTSFGKGITLFVLGSLIVSEFVSSMGVMAVVTQSVQEWSRTLTSDGEGFSPLWLTFLFGGLLYVLFLKGRYSFFEKILVIFVSVMGVSFLVTSIAVIPDPAEIMRGLVPSIPKESNAALLVAGMVGTTMGAVLYVIRSILVQEKGWTIENFAEEKRDAFISALLMFVLSFAIMASAAGTLYVQGHTIENAIDMVRLLEPFAGRFALSIFVAGIVCAGLSSFFPIMLLGPWLLADFQGKKADMHTWQNRLLVLCVVLIAFVVPIFGARPVFVMLISQALITIATPVILLLMWILLNKKEEMGAYVATTRQNVIMGVIILFSLLMAAVGVVGIAGSIG